ncbi:MAG: hypothetical protein EZS28_021055, partial [Streblomastix strix]
MDEFLSTEYLDIDPEEEQELGGGLQSRVLSTTSLASLASEKKEDLAGVPNVIMNSIKSFVGSGILS